MEDLSEGSTVSLSYENWSRGSHSSIEYMTDMTRLHDLIYTPLVSIPASPFSRVHTDVALKPHSPIRFEV
jgi:hypothetical protein